MMRNSLVISVEHRIRPTNATREADHQAASQFLTCASVALRTPQPCSQNYPRRGSTNRAQDLGRRSELRLFSHDNTPERHVRSLSCFR
jgi:hypothetical protein